MKTASQFPLLTTEYRSTSVFDLRAIFKRLSGDTLVYGLGTTFSRAVSFLLLPFYARALAPSEYALADVLLTFGSIVAIVAELGIGSGIVLIFQTEDQRLQSRMLTSNLIFQMAWSILLSGVLILMARPISGLLLKDANLAHFAVLVFLLIPVQGLVGFAQNLYKWKRKPMHLILIAIGVSVLTACSTIWFVLFRGQGAKGLLLGPLVASAVFALVGLISILKYLKRGLDVKDVRDCFLLGAPFALAATFNTFIPNINRFFLVNLVGLDGAGVYAMGLKLCYIIVFFSISFEMAYYPFALSIQKSPHALSLYVLVSRLFALALMIASVSMMLFAKPIVEIILGNKDYSNAYKIMGPSLLAFWIQGLTITFQMGVIIARKSYHVIWVYALGALVSIPLNAILISSMGIQGAAWAAVGVQLVLTGAFFYANQHVYPVPYEFKPVIRLAIAYLAFMIISNALPVLLPAVDLIARFGLGMGFLVLALLWSGAIKQEERSLCVRTAGRMLLKFARLAQ
jgi:O-antigen/teichoic acid export membrane protein